MWMQTSRDSFYSQEKFCASSFGNIAKAGEFVYFKSKLFKEVRSQNFSSFFTEKFFTFGEFFVINFENLGDCVIEATGAKKW